MIVKTVSKPNACIKSYSTRSKARWQMKIVRSNAPRLEHCDDRRRPASCAPCGGAPVALLAPRIHTKVATHQHHAHAWSLLCGNPVFPQVKMTFSASHFCHAQFLKARSRNDFFRSFEVPLDDLVVPF
jgi:hypothetical protein